MAVPAGTERRVALALQADFSRLAVVGARLQRRAVLPVGLRAGRREKEPDMTTPDKDIVIMGEAEEGAIQQARNCLVEAEAMLLMADNHKGYGMPVGGVAVYADRIPPAGVGFDIGCGNKAVRTTLNLADIQGRLAPLADEIHDSLAFGVGQANTVRVEHELFDDPIWETSDFLKGSRKLKATARAQLGSIGAGNHYVDVFADEQDRIW
ncbi:MAG: RtcB family protein, partial [Pararhodobacter sp.]|nr:RtcB family protein [Pararhodobacter sp.]